MGQLSSDPAKIEWAKSCSNDVLGCRAQIGDVYLGGGREISRLGGLLSLLRRIEGERSEKDSI